MLRYFFLSKRFYQFLKQSEYVDDIYEAGLSLVKKSERPNLYQAYYTNNQQFFELKQPVAREMFAFLHHTQHPWGSFFSWIPGTASFRARRTLARSLSQAKQLYQTINVQYFYLTTHYTDKNKTIYNTSTGVINQRKISRKTDLNLIKKKSTNKTNNTLPAKRDEISTLARCSFWRLLP